MESRHTKPKYQFSLSAWRLRKPKISPAFLLFTLLLILGIAVLPQYGILWDEPSLRSHGTFNLVYIFRTLFPTILPRKYLTCNSIACFPSLDDWNAYTHGAWFEVLLSIFEVLFGLENPNRLGTERMHDIYLLRHSAIFLFCWFGLLNFYFFLKREFASPLIALLGILLSLSSPRLVGEMFNDSKDLIFLSMFMIGMNVFSIYLRRRTLSYLCLLSLVLGLTAGRRIVALGLILTISFALFLMPRFTKGVRKISATLESVYLLLMSLFFFYLSMPYIWDSPLSKTWKVFSGNRDFVYNGLEIFNGQLVSTSDLPRTYLLTWILITVPIFQIILLLAATALFSFLFTRLSLPRVVFLISKHQVFCCYFIFCFLCLSYVQLFNPVNLMGWRHFYFFNSVFVYAMCIIIKALRDKLRSRFNLRASAILTTFILLLGCIPTWSWMIRNHPAQSQYFNKLAGNAENIPFRWTVQWTAGTTQALRWILKNDNRAKISVGSLSENRIANGYILLKEDEKKRLCLANRGDYCQGSEPDYYINIFYAVVDTLDSTRYILVKQFNADQQPLLQIYKRT